MGNKGKNKRKKAENKRDEQKVLQIYMQALKKAEEFKLGEFQTRFLAAMVTQKYLSRHENMEYIAGEAMKSMPELFGEKKNIVLVSAGKSLNQLEMALEESEERSERTLPETGQLVSKVVKNLVVEIGELHGEYITPKDLSAKREY